MPSTLTDPYAQDVSPGWVVFLFLFSFSSFLLFFHSFFLSKKSEFNSKTHIKETKYPGMMVQPWGGGDREVPGADWLASLAESEGSKSMRDSVSKINKNGLCLRI